MKYTIKKINLKNNSKLLLINGIDSDRVLFGYGIRAGFINAPKDKFELPHLLEHLILKDDNKEDEKSLSCLLEKNGTYFNAHTEDYITKFVFVTAKENIKEVINLGIDRLINFNPTISDINTEIAVVTDETERFEDNIKEKWNFQFTKMISPYWRTPVERLKSLKKIKINDVNDFFSKYYIANNTYYILAGSFSAKEAKDLQNLIEKTIKKQKLGSKNQIIKSQPKEYAEKIFTIKDKKAKRVYSTFSFISLLNVLNIKPEIKVLYTILNDGMHSRLSRNLRAAGLSYGIDGGYTLDKNLSYLELSFFAPKEKFIKLFKAVLWELKEIAEGNFTKAELTRAKGFLIGDIEADHSLVLDLANWYGNDFVLDDELTDYNDFLNKIRKLNKIEIINASKKFLNKNSWSLILAGDVTEDIKKDCRKIIYEYLSKKL